MKQKKKPSYDLVTFFQQFSCLHISGIALKCGLNPSLMRQYSSGVKSPSKKRTQEIEASLRKVGKQLTRIKLRA